MKKCFHLSITKIKYKLIRMVANTYYLEIDVYFIEYPLAVEIDEKKHADRDLIFEEKRQEALEKKTWL